jgi:phosphatidylserine/phosphatidylglycerophosphate/cardiolipin synthase-like enzyme
MRQRKIKSGLTVNAVAGTHVVLLGFDLAGPQRKGCLGFAIQRRDETEDELSWIKGTKTFAATNPGIGPGGQVSSRDHPFQAFQWADYSAKPAHAYTYNILPLYGTPKNLKEGVGVSVRITTEGELGKPHSAFFNRGAVASQEYARRFQNKAPDQLEGKQREAAYAWLSRGLLEAFRAFVGRAKGKSFGLYGAIYEFQWPEALEAFKAAAASGADVHVVYDGIAKPTGPKLKNEAAIHAAGIEAICQPRTKGKIMHNKFFVLTKNKKPIAVWTGSTNLTENGIFGHSNLGHIVEDAQIASAYFNYWNELKDSPEADAERIWVAQNNPNPPNPWTAALTPVFSPRKGLAVLEWYAGIANPVPKRPLFMTFAFGMHKDFQQVYEQKDGILRFALMEKEGNGAGLAQGKKDIRRIRSLPNVVIAVGTNIVTNSFDRWLKERQQLTAEANVRYIHTKYMLVDPLGKNPIVVTGSANFSEPSTDENNENMVVIRNDTRAADIYVGEFMRLYSHYAFREAVAIAQEKGETDWKPSDLAEDDSWQKDYFKEGSARFLRRRYFAGT